MTCSHVSLILHNRTFLLDLFVLPIKEAKVILGIQRLKKFGPITFDYQTLTMIFKWKGEEVKLEGPTQISGRPLGLKQLHKLECSGEVAELFHLKAKTLIVP